MLQEASALCSDISAVGRLSFAAATLHRDTPGYWDLVCGFGFINLPACPKPSSDKVKVFLENVKYLEDNAFASDVNLSKELMEQKGFLGRPLGIVLISSNNKCGLCGGSLLV